MSINSISIDGEFNAGRGTEKVPLQLLCEGLLRLMEGAKSELLLPALDGLTHAIGIGCDSTIELLKLELSRIDEASDNLRALTQSPLISLGSECEAVLQRLKLHRDQLVHVIESLIAIRPADSVQDIGENVRTAVEARAPSALISVGEVISPVTLVPLENDEQSEVAQANVASNQSKSRLDSLCESADAARRDGNSALAEQLYTEVLNIDGNQVAALMQRGRLRLICRKTDLAAEDFSCAIRLNGRDPAAFCARGDAYALCNRLDAAIADYTQSLKLQPGFLLSKYNRAVAFRLRGKLELAFDEFSELLKMRPEHGPAYLNRGIIHELKGEWAEAASDFRKSLRYQPMSREALQHLQAVRTMLEDDSEETRLTDLSATKPSTAASSPTNVVKEVCTPKHPTPREGQDSLVVPCPSCKTATSISWSKLQPGRVLKCPYCQVNFTMKPNGELEEIVKASTGRWMFRATVNAKTRELRERRLQVAGMVSVALILAMLWWFPRTGQSSSGPAEINLPQELEARAELLARAWLTNDSRLIRRLTDPVHDRLLFTWSRRFPPPHLTQTPEKLTKEVKIELTRLPSQPPVAWLQARINGIEGRSSPLEMRFAWEERSGVWYFQPAIQ